MKCFYLFMYLFLGAKNAKRSCRSQPLMQKRREVFRACEGAAGPPREEEAPGGGASAAAERAPPRPPRPSGQGSRLSLPPSRKPGRRRPPSCLPACLPGGAAGASVCWSRRLAGGSSAAPGLGGAAPLLHPRRWFPILARALQRAAPEAAEAARGHRGGLPLPAPPPAEPGSRFLPSFLPVGGGASPGGRRKRIAASASGRGRRLEGRWRRRRAPRRGSWWRLRGPGCRGLPLCRSPAAPGAASSAYSSAPRPDASASAPAPTPAPNR